MRYEEILKFWFGQVEQTVIPTENQARLWFDESPLVDEEIRKQFSGDLEAASAGQFDLWCDSPRGRLALLIVLDQFSRHIYRDTPKAFSQDAKALEICQGGITQQADHQLSLIERVFYYFPLLHSETIKEQELSIANYQLLVDVAFPETKMIYDSFLKFARYHYSVIRRFGRFPQRNEVLSRVSTPEEVTYLKEARQYER